MSGLVQQQAQTASFMIDAMLALLFSEQGDRLHHTLIPEASLARAAVECLGTGLWLLLPQDYDVRQRRYLQYSIDDMANREQITNDVSGKR
jgi:hypothetical protein